MTRQEKKDALDSGKILYTYGGYRAWLEVDHKFGPYVLMYPNGDMDYMTGAWDWGTWIIEGEREFDFKPFDKVVVRDANNQRWKCALYSHYHENCTYQFICVGNAYKQIAHFKDNEKYLGTTDDIPGKWTAEDMEK
jgi:hypothetical protein